MREKCQIHCHNESGKNLSTRVGRVTMNWIRTLFILCIDDLNTSLYFPPFLDLSSNLRSDLDEVADDDSDSCLLDSEWSPRLPLLDLLRSSSLRSTLWLPPPLARLGK